MLHIIVLILKIIGIILLSVISLLLMLVLLALFVPVRYRVKAQFKDGADIQARLGWLFHILHAKVSYAEGKHHIRLHVFGIKVYDSQKPARSPKGRKKGRHNMKRDYDRAPASDKRAALRGSTPHREHDSPSMNITPLKEGKSDRDAPHIAKEEGYEGTGDKAEKPRRLKQKLKDFISSIVSFFGFRHKLRLIKNFLVDEITKTALGISWTSLRRLLKHLAPARLKAEIIFGTGDPCSTGQALGVLAFFYGIYGEHIKLTPDFENKIIEGKLYVRGRIRLITILIIVIKLLIDKKFKEMMKNFKLLKEALS